VVPVCARSGPMSSPRPPEKNRPAPPWAARAKERLTFWQESRAFWRSAARATRRPLLSFISRTLRSRVVTMGVRHARPAALGWRGHPDHRTADRSREALDQVLRSHHTSFGEGESRLTGPLSRSTCFSSLLGRSHAVVIAQGARKSTGFDGENAFSILPMTSLLPSILRLLTPDPGEKSILPRSTQTRLGLSAESK
jgi:hypothetical protein